MVARPVHVKLDERYHGLLHGWTVEEDGKLFAVVERRTGPVAQVGEVLLVEPWAVTFVDGPMQES